LNVLHVVVLLDDAPTLRGAVDFKDPLTVAVDVVHEPKGVRHSSAPSFEEPFFYPDDAEANPRPPDRLYLENGEDIGNFATAVPNWSIGIEFFNRDHALFRIVNIVPELDEGEFSGFSS
jgi:hypothetical protein